MKNINLYSLVQDLVSEHVKLLNFAGLHLGNVSHIPMARSAFRGLNKEKQVDNAIDALGSITHFEPDMSKDDVAALDLLKDKVWAIKGIYVGEYL